LYIGQTASQTVLEGSKETGELPWQDIHRFDDVFGQNPTDVIEGAADEG
jgi:hypothetical protein